ncbi:ester cyclase [Nonomuraea insulae]|uniref:Ester cyclase n=1 Tax=Nonomuraea insulae TaxID=1616787 RepID=A0ABW1CMA3_9ACTN
MGTSEENKEIVRGFFAEVWNKGNFAYMDTLYTDDFQLNALWQNTSLGGSGTAAREEAKATIARWLDGFPDMHVTVEEQIAEGDFVASRHVAVGTQGKEFMGIPNTGKRGAVSGITINRIDGKQVAETWTCWDAAGMMMQLGIIPSPPRSGPPEDTDAAWAAQKQLVDSGTAEETKAVVRRFYQELWTEGRLEAADELFAPNFIGHAPGNGLTRGPEGVKALVGGWRDGVPDMTLEIHAQYAEGSRCATRFTGRGTHKGTWLGIPATGQEVSLSGIAITRVIDGQVVSDWGEFDVMGLLQQLGVVKRPGRPPAQ